MKHLLILSSLLFISFSFWSCNNIPNGGIPVYLEINSVDFKTKLDNGTSSSKITDVWVTVNGKTIGTFQVPAKIPILQSGALRVELSAGIKDNGITNTRAQYPFYASDTFTIPDGMAGKTYERKPVFDYISGVKFAFMEDFDATGSFSGLAYNSNPADSNVFEGARSGKMYLGPNDTAELAYTTNAFPITGAGQEVYVELNYKCDAYFECGMLSFKNGVTTDLYKITFNPHTSWNKTYLNFSNQVGATLGDNYRLYFKLTKLPDGSSASVFLDNIKIVQH